MDSKVAETTDIYDWIAWAKTNQKRLITIVIVIAVAGLMVGLYALNTSHREAAANEALSNIKVPMPSREHPVPPPTPADAYLKVAADYPGTSGGARALLLGAGALFDNGKFKDADDTFQKFLQQYPDHPLALQAELGVAASLEAQGKTADAVSRYKDIRDRHPQDSRQVQDPAVVQATVALAHLYVVQGKPDSAAKVYEDVLKNGRSDSWTEEAEVERDQLLAKYPELRPKPPAAPAPVTQPAVKMNPTPAPSAAPAASTPIPSPKQTGAVPLTITN